MVREAGFSLIETLVALAVIAAMAATVFAAIESHAQAAALLARRREAVMLARSALAEATVPGGDTAEGGRWHGLVWRRSVHRAPVEARGEGAPLEEVRIEVSDGASGRRLTRVATLRLAR